MSSGPSRASRVLALAVFVVVLCIPWPDARGPSLAKSIWLTARDVNKTAALALSGYAAFRAELDTPGSGEYVLPGAVQQALTILHGRGRAVKRYDLSPSLRADDWVLQQMVVAAWPRRLEPHATARFILNTDPIDPGCTPIDRQRDVSLVYCP